MNIQEYIDSLPHDRLEIAKILRQKGIKGRKKCGTDCPIFHLLKREDQNISHVTRGFIGFFNRDDIVMLTFAISGFIWAFDHGEFPELEI